MERTEGKTFKAEDRGDETQRARRPLDKIKTGAAKSIGKLSEPFISRFPGSERRYSTVLPEVRLDAGNSASQMRS